ncbi:MAG: hypothetical protein IJG82_04945 [Atopobiaceae bacterium]|nr:hypothetical protein [Atopobiaceae bacterium]
MADSLFEGIEIPDELLESIAGGVLTDEVRSVLDQTIPLLKQKGTTLERTLEIFSLTEDQELREDSLAYIKEIWDTL